MKSSDPPTFFGAWVKKRRKALDLTQEELAEDAGCSVFALRKIESGERRPSKQLAGLLAQSLKIPSEDVQTFVRVARGDLNLERLSAPAHHEAGPALQEIQPAAYPIRIPLQPTPLIGRDAELAAMERIFKNPECRLLTLTGMGGVGKTRLAIEFASGQRAAFSGGVYFVPLAPVNRAEAIVPAVADAIGFGFSGPTEPKDQLLHHIQHQPNHPLLLILDNLEHLLVQQAGDEDPGAAGLVSEFLQRLPNLKILATSRARLNLHGEWTYEIHGLPIPPEDFSEAPEAYSAVTLFIQSARRAKFDFEVTPEERAALVKICQLLDGIPLAIELAAAWVGMLTCGEIAREIDANIDFLTTSMRDIPERHRSIRASFDHSWKLLSPEEQHILSRLSVFQGGFERCAAEQVAGASLPVLASLASKSLVRRMENGRFDLHEVIRQYAASHLGDERQSRPARDRHCDYYLNFAADREKALKSASQQEAVRELTDEMDNVRAAWKHAIRHERYTLMERAIQSLGWFFEASGLLQEGIDQFNPLVQALRAGPPEDTRLRVLGLALTQQGLMYFRKGRFDEARSHYEEGIAALRRSGSRPLLAAALVFRGIILHLDGEYERSCALLREALDCALAGGDEWFAAYALYNLGYVDSLAGHYTEGYERMIAGLQIWRSLGDPHSIALGLNYLVPTQIRLGRYEEAEADMQESIRICTQTKNRWGLGTAYRHLGLAYLAQGNLAQAQANLYKSLEVFQDFVVGWDIARTLSYLGDAARVAGDLSQARETYLEALQLSIEAKATPIALDCLLGLAHVLEQKGEFEPALELSEHVSRNPASPQDSSDCARQLSDRMIKGLGPEEVNAARSRWKAKTFEEITAEVAR